MRARDLPWWQDRTSAGIAELAARDAVALLPLSAIEQHGPHLPLETDYRIGLGLLRTACEALPEDLPRVVLPPVAVATSHEHTDFPGTLTLRPETALALLRDLGESVARSGLRRLLIVNSHGGNTAICDLAALELRRDHSMLVVKHHYFTQPPPPEFGIPAEELRHGLHGGLIETAMMRFLAPETVHMDAAADAPSLGATLAETMEVLEPEGRASFAWMAQDLNHSGVVGDARAATADLGERLVAHYAGILAAAIRDTARFDLAQLRA
ncbi:MULTISPECIES: creatininase family protein [unclassified Thioalkalivibrio]|uniref:creatininase family protein n=1 Tax=unclassified Thioalkalivibrio TaxID=2621013 RepID=UPI00035F363B|nr:MULTISPECIES: creatininase family protein [unclassified Thioalkalivibrio]